MINLPAMMLGPFAPAWQRIWFLRIHNTHGIFLKTNLDFLSWNHPSNCTSFQFTVSTVRCARRPSKGRRSDKHRSTEMERKRCEWGIQKATLHQHKAMPLVESSISVMPSAAQLRSNHLQILNCIHQHNRAQQHLFPQQQQKGKSSSVYQCL